MLRLLLGSVLALVALLSNPAWSGTIEVTYALNAGTLNLGGSSVDTTGGSLLVRFGTGSLTPGGTLSGPITILGLQVDLATPVAIGTQAAANAFGLGASLTGQGGSALFPIWDIGSQPAVFSPGAQAGYITSGTLQLASSDPSQLQLFVLSGTIGTLSAFARGIGILGTTGFVLSLNGGREVSRGPGGEVPAPGSAVLLLTGLAAASGVAWWRRRPVA